MFLIVAIFLSVHSANAPRAEFKSDAEYRAKIVEMVAMLPTHAGYPSGYTNSTMLPQWCNHTWDGQIKDRELMLEYFRKYGWEFQHMHHYCRGLFDLHEAVMAVDEYTRSDRFEKAIGQFDYVLGFASADFVLRPELLSRKGVALLGLDRAVEAVGFFQQAIELRDDYVPAYVALGNYFSSVDDTSQARQILRAGLARVPQSAVLKRQLDELGPDRPEDATSR